MSWDDDCQVDSVNAATASNDNENENGEDVDVDVGAGDAGEVEAGGDDGWGSTDGDDWGTDDTGNNSSSKTTTTATATSSSSSSSSKMGKDEDDSNPDGAFPLLSRQQSWLVLNNSSLEEKQRALIAQVAEVLDVTQEEAGCLLRQNGWKAKKLETDWFNDSDAVRKQVGLSESSSKPPAVTISQSDGTVTVQCQSAFCDEVPLDQAHALNCGHYFCQDCWSGYLTSQLNSGRTCVSTTCMGMRCTLQHPHKFGCACKEIVPESMFSRFVSDTALVSKYRGWLLDLFVEGQRNIKWCPKPGCTNAVSYTVGGTKMVACDCKYVFCFSCSEEAHSPAPCDLVRSWLHKEKSDDATAIWLAARTKECPKCLVRIEKNKACNHMSCVKCGHNFCWLCKGPWSSHGSSSGGYYVCNKYEADVKEGKLTSEESAMQKNQRTLQKYTYYYKRFKGSVEGIAFTRKLALRIEERMSGEDLSKYSFLLDATAKLINARRVLQWTYMLAYYLKNGGKKHLFEYQQELLVGATEALQEIMDNNASEMDKLLSMRKDIINKTSSMDKFRSEMVEQVERGEFEDLLLLEADVELESWACSVCKADNKKDAILCVGCTACNLHGEQDCKACATRVKAAQAKAAEREAAAAAARASSSSSSSSSSSTTTTTTH